MNGSTANSSSSMLSYFWLECYAVDDDGVRTTKPSEGLSILIFTCCMEALFGGPLNAWLICHILRKRSKAPGIPPADFFPFHLAITEFLFDLNIPVAFVNHHVWQSIFVVNIMTFFCAMELIMKPLLLCLVCVERYIAVLRPHDYLRFKAPKYKWGCFGFSGCLFVTIASVVLFSNRSYLTSLLFLPILITDTFCCFSVLKCLQKPPPGDKNMMERKKKRKEEEKRKTPVVQTEEGTGGERAESGRGESRSMKKKAIVTIVFVQVVLTFNYAPLIITVFLQTVVPAHALKCQILPVSLAAAICCSYLQPLFYLHRLGFLTCSKRPVNTWKVRR